jgi:iron complex outermembrane receptor protein
MIDQRFVSRAALAAALLAGAAPAVAQTAPGDPGSAGTPSEEAVSAGDAIIVTGTRRTDRTVAESASPIDVFTPADVVRQGSADTNQILQNLVPSFSVQRYAIGDGSSFVRPPNLRGLPPDETLVLLNGKRRHRSALVQLGGGSLSEGSQAADLNQIPAIAIGRIEVLRDGASAQYGSDAIAGVINIGLRENDRGLTGYLRYGQFYEGDGEDYQAAANLGLGLGDFGFLSISGEYLDSAPTSRGVTRVGALAVQQMFPNLDVRDPAQRWGNPGVEAVRLFANGGIDLGPDSEIYFFGNYGHSYQEESFNYRQPYAVSVTGPDGSPQTIGQAGIFAPIYLDQLANGNYDAEGETFSFLEFYPGGFTPWFFGTIDDVSLTAGYRGTLGFGLSYDISASYGQNRLKYSMIDTLNASMGPASPQEVTPGYLEQRETNFNADFSYPVEIGFASPLTLAFGAETRRESYELGLGDEASWAIGPYAVQVVERDDGTTFNVSQPVGSNGFPGYGPSIAGSSSRRSYAAYVDVETDVTDALSLGLAGRFEHFTDFGDTTTGKISARYEFSPAIAVRGTASTGFRAPSPGQVNTSSIATTFDPGNPNPIESATLPVTDPAAQFFGATPLTPEKATNLSAGLVLTPLDGATLTVDYYNIKVRDRIGTSQPVTIDALGDPAAVREQLRLLGVANYLSLGEVAYLTNAFDTRTEGVDVVGSYVLRTEGGSFNTTIGFNYNKTTVTDRKQQTVAGETSFIIGDERVFNMQNILPKYRVVVTETWTLDPFSVLVRGNYYSSYAAQDGGLAQRFSGEIVFDLEATYSFNEQVSLTLGAQNIFDNYPERDERGGVYPSTGGLFAGNVYPDFSPFGFNGGFVYGRLGFTF